MLDIEQLPAIFASFRNRWSERDARMRTLVEAVNGDYDLIDDEGDEITMRSPNLVHVALEDTAEAAAVVPTIRVDPSETSDKGRTAAAAMERLGVGYFDQSQVELLSIRLAMDIAAYGFMSVVVLVDDETGSPRFYWRDPRTVWPEPGWQTMDACRRAIVAREVHVTQLPDEWYAKLKAEFHGKFMNDLHVSYWEDKKVQIVEYYDQDEIVLALLYEPAIPNSGVATNQTSWLPVELDRYKTAGVCPMVVQQRPSLDGEPRGQFDQVINVMRGHIRLMGAMLEYADQAVYSDVWVKDVIGQMPMGGGSYIELGPNGAIGRLAPAVSSMQVFENLQQLMDGVHLGGRWPKVRPGEVDQAIITGKALEASAGMMNTAIRTMHLVMKRAFEQMLRIGFEMDKQFGRNRTVAGVLRNQQFQIERNKDDIDTKAKVRVEYGMGLGRDPAQAMVISIQAMQSGIVSLEFVRENFDGITDVALEAQRIDIQNMRDMAFAKLMQGLESGQIPERALIDIKRARESGDDIFELYYEYVIKPQEAAMEQQLQGALPGSGPLQPGMAPPPPEGGMAPPPPDMAGMIAGLAGAGGVPGAEQQAISRLSTPAGGPGSFAGVQVTQ